ncbi:MAG: hypothetical protein WCC90_11385 [Methylocella sp.]
MSSNLAAVIRWFPSQKQAIEERAARDESFRSMCDDLADAESALQKLENSQSPKRDRQSKAVRHAVDKQGEQRSEELPGHFTGVIVRNGKITDVVASNGAVKIEE